MLNEGPLSYDQKNEINAVTRRLFSNRTQQKHNSVRPFLNERNIVALLTTFRFSYFDLVLICSCNQQVIDVFLWIMKFPAVSVFLLQYSFTFLRFTDRSQNRSVFRWQLNGGALKASLMPPRHRLRRDSAGRRAAAWSPNSKQRKEADVQRRDSGTQTSVLLNTWGVVSILQRHISVIQPQKPFKGRKLKQMKNSPSSEQKMIKHLTRRNLITSRLVPADKLTVGAVNQLSS